MATDRAKDPSYLSGPSARDVRRSYVEEQYPILLRNNRLRASDLPRLRDEASAFDYRPPISILMPLLNPDVRWLEQALDSVVAQLYPNWELIVCSNDSTEEHVREILSSYERLNDRVKLAYEAEQGARGMTQLSNAALSVATGEFACLLGEADELSPEALFEVAKLLEEHPEADLIYSDEDAIDERGNRSHPRFKPGFSPDLLLSTDYVSRLSVYRRSVVEAVGGFREGFEGAEEHDLILRLTECTEEILHLPRVLYHRRVGAGPALAGEGEGRAREGGRRALTEALERRGMEGWVEDGLIPGTFRARPEIKGEPLVSIIIPTRNHAHLLKSCIESIERLTSYPNYEILIVDNDSTEPATLEYLARTPHRVIPFKEKYNHPKINNLASSHAEGEYLVLLNDDIEVIGGGWLEAMLEHAQRPEVGAVGARLLYPDGRIQHAGVVTTSGVWMSGIATHAHQYYGADSAGYLGTLVTTTNYSAVTAACMMVPKAVYEEVGRLDEENLPVSFDDVDLCLRMRERGYLIVYTPYAELYHYESATLGESVTVGYRLDDPAESNYMRERWGEVLDADPYYNPHFSRGSGDFNIRADLLRPRALREDSVSSFDGAPQSSTDVLSMSPEELDEYLRLQRTATRDSCRAVIVPRSSAGIVETTLPEILEHKILETEKAFAPQKKHEQAHQVEASRTPKSLHAERLIWMFGSPRTGSTWLSKMMAELENQERWNEPYVGLMFGSFLYERLEGNRKLLDSPAFILGEPYRKIWLESVKNFVIDGAAARYPNLGDDHYLVIKEPNGSVGASLLMEAMPESRMIFLIRDGRDVIASRLDAVDKDGWTRQNRDLDTSEKLNAFTKHLAEDYFRVVSQVQKAYEEHPGKKAFVRYEDLRRDTLGTLRAMYADLEIECDEAQLAAAVDKQSWEQIPESSKGSGKFYRKAEPGSWKEDLSPDQIRIIEDITASILSKYY